MVWLKSDNAIEIQHSGRFSGSAFFNTAIQEFLQIFSKTTSFFLNPARHFEIGKFYFIFGISILDHPYAGVCLSFLWNEQFFQKSRLSFSMRHFEFSKFDFIFRINILKNPIRKRFPKLRCGRWLFQ